MTNVVPPAERSRDGAPSTIAAVVLFATVLGAAVRIYLPMSAPAPLNDGGLFYAMIRDLQAASYSLPAFTSYNFAGIPYAYPPFAFYFTGLVADLLGLEVLDLVRILPAVLSALTIPAFYLLAREVLGSRTRALLPTIIFAFLPRTMDWLVMGGGITRSLGLFFALLCTRQIVLLFTSGSWRNALEAVPLGSLVVLTHPEAAVHAALNGVVFYVLLSRSRRGLLQAAAVALGVLACSTPWWGTIALRHGWSVFVAPLTAASQDSLPLLARVFSLFGFQFTDEPFLTLLAVLGLVGMAVKVVRREFLVPVWLVVTYLAEPRGGGLYLMVPLAMLIASALEVVVLPGLSRLGRGPTLEASSDVASDGRLEHMLRDPVSKWVLGYVLIYSVMSAFYVILVIHQRFSLKAGDLAAMDWVRQNTPTTMNFALITGERPLRDSSSEWFPALAERRSVATVFGYEWINDGRFGERSEGYLKLQACSNGGTDCLEQWRRTTGAAFDCVYIRRYVEDRAVDRPLESSLRASREYSVVFESEMAVILCAQPFVLEPHAIVSTMTATKISAR